MTPTRRVGILGGTFDPIHCGHLDVLSAAGTALGLTEVLVLPSHIPPHRPQPQASSYHRFAMVALAVAGRSRWRASDLELREGARSYTSETLQHLHAAGFGAAELFFIVGADAFAEISTWKDYPSIFDLAHFAVVSRPGLSVTALAERLPQLAARMRTVDVHASASSTPLIFLIDQPTADVSSTAIRRRCANGEPVAGLVAPSVQQHIEQHGLYQRDPAVSNGGGDPTGRAAGGLHGQD